MGAPKNQKPTHLDGRAKLRQKDGSVNVVYDGDGNRVSETVAGVTTAYLVDTVNPTGYAQVMDELVSGSVTRTYAYGLQRLSENQLISGAWTPSFYGYDGHGSVRYLANPNGSVTDTYEYDAFGTLIASTGSTPNSYLFSGEQFDPALNLYQMRARWYREATGRFISRDPDEQKSCCGCSNSCKSRSCSPGPRHPYLYADDDPVNRIDPTGREDLAEYELNVSRIETEVELMEIGSKEEIAGCIVGCTVGCIALFWRDPMALSTCKTACVYACNVTD